MNSRRRVTVVLVDRANYGRLKPVMHAIQNHPGLEITVIAAGTMVLERFSTPVKVLEQDGFPVDARVYMEVEGSVPVTMAKSFGLGVIEFANEFQRLAPDIVLIIGDRYEALAAGIAAAYMNLCIVHVQGGEVSGSIDESARHALSKFAHYHVPSTQRAADYLIRMGERPDTILAVGCPGSDIAFSIARAIDPETINGRGSGTAIDPSQPFLLAVFHPVTTGFGGEAAQMNELLHALDDVAVPTVLLWPNIDAGSDHISRTIRVFRDARRPAWLRTLINLEPENYLRVLAGTACAVGNSSSFVRDAGYFGTPVVLAGDRQEGRETDTNVVPVAPERGAIAAAIRSQLGHGRYPASYLYGDGSVSPRIAESLTRLEPYTQKRLFFVEEAKAAGAKV